jgi:hypothetical protein
MDDKIDRVDGDEAAKVWWERLQKRGFTGIKDHAEIRTYLPHIERFFCQCIYTGQVQQIACAQNSPFTPLFSVSLCNVTENNNNH